jgi:hypothetical protein
VRHGIFPKRIIDEDRLKNMCVILNSIYSEDTRSSGSMGREDKVPPHWLLRDVETSEEDDA